MKIAAAAEAFHDLQDRIEAAQGDDAPLSGEARDTIVTTLCRQQNDSLEQLTRSKPASWEDLAAMAGVVRKRVGTMMDVTEGDIGDDNNGADSELRLALALAKGVIILTERTP